MFDQVGSVCLMVSAIAAFTLKAACEATDIGNLGMGAFGGAIGFLVGSHLLPLSPVRRAGEG